LIAAIVSNSNRNSSTLLVIFALTALHVREDALTDILAIGVHVPS
jgi:hypothetical protein